MKIKFLIVVSILISSCSEEKSNVNVLPDDKFVSILIQMHLIEADLVFAQTLDKVVFSQGYSKYVDVFKKYNTDSAQVANTFMQYENRKEDLLKIYTKVLDSLTVIAQKNQKIK